MSYTNRKFNWDFNSLNRFYNNYVLKWVNSAMGWTAAQMKQARANLGFGNGDIDDEPTAGSNNLVKSGGVQNELALGAVYDVSAKNPTAGPNNDGKWGSLSALLSDANLSTLIPTSVRRGGMSIKFVQSSDNKYVQYRLMHTLDNASTAVADFANTANWQGVDSEPTTGSDNLVKSGGVFPLTKLNTMTKATYNLFNKFGNYVVKNLYLYGNLSVLENNDTRTLIIPVNVVSGTCYIFYIRNRIANSIRDGLKIGIANSIPSSGDTIAAVIASGIGMNASKVEGMITATSNGNYILVQVKYTDNTPQNDIIADFSYIINNFLIAVHDSENFEPDKYPYIGADIIDIQME